MKNMMVLMGGVVIAGMFALAAAAAPVNITGVTGIWAAVTPSNASNLTGLNTTAIDWGIPATAGGKSSYGFDATEPLADVAAGAGFDIGTFIHKNNPIYGQSITSATLQVAIHLLIGDATEVINATFAFSHLETTNKPAKEKYGTNKGKRICADGGLYGQGVNSSGCADRVVLSVNEGATTSFVYGDDRYDFSLTGFDGYFNGADTIWTMESATKAVGLLGMYTVTHIPPPPSPPSPVPLPAAGFMLFSALFGLGALSRKRRSV